MLPLSATRLRLSPTEVETIPAGSIMTVVRKYLVDSEESGGGLVLLGGFDSGKTHLCEILAAGAEPDFPPCTSVPLRVVARAESIEQGLQQVVGTTRLNEARLGERVLLLDGLDEVPVPDGGWHTWYRRLTARSGPRWILTSRPSHFRTSEEETDDQADSLADPHVTTVVLDPLSPEVVSEVVSALPNGEHLLQSVEGLKELARSPLLLHIVHAAAPFIEPGRPIQPWGVFDAWLRHALSTGPDHDHVIDELEALAWNTFAANNHSVETTSFGSSCVAKSGIPASVRRALMVTDLDGRCRFGHRSVFEFLLASRIAPALGKNQGHGPDSFTGIHLTDATRAFVVGRVPPMPVMIDGDRVRIPRGNFIRGGLLSPDERPLRIAHLAEPFWISRVPVTHEDWRRFLADRPDHRQDANYLRHWGVDRQMPPLMHDAPVYDIWPDDADRYATWSQARLPTADEWEKAVRGTDGRTWPWGDLFKPELAVTSELGLSRPLDIRAFGALGPSHLFTAAGGVFEYTSSWYRERPDRGRVVMGGCFTHPSATSRSSLRLSHRLSGNLRAGLRLAWSLT